jgi:protein-L-isoaspartate(D-aspartate) O-methyltransferase
VKPDKASLIERIGRRVHDQRVLAALGDVPRELFVPERLRGEAWRDRALPIGQGQTISQPFVVARMCELLELRGDENVLDVGTGSGYEAAGVENVTLVCGDGTKGYAQEAPYDAINVGAGAHGVPSALLDQLAEGGRMVIPSDAHGQRLVVLRRRNGGFEEEKHEFVRFVPLISEPEAGLTGG